LTGGGAPSAGRPLAAKVELVELVIPSRLAYLPGARRLLEEVLSAAGFDAAEIEDLRLAFHEVVVNAVRHGNAEDPRKRVRIAIGLGDDGVEVVVRDEGRGFDPEKLGAPLAGEELTRRGGRGLLLARHFLDRLEIESAPGGPTTVRLVKRRAS